MTVDGLEAAVPAGHSAASVRPLLHTARERLRRVEFVLTGIDDTLTTGGPLPAVAYSALEGSGMHRNFARPENKRRKNRDRLNDIASTIFSTEESDRLSADQAFGEADLAIDIDEDGPPLIKAATKRIVDCFEAAGAMAKVSSIYVNGWFGKYGKLTIARRLFQDMYAIDINAKNEKALFVGGSNDAPMFGFFENSIEVANFSAFSSQVKTQPKYITAAAGVLGFAGVAAALLEERGG